jgi:hypothetical protein
MEKLNLMHKTLIITMAALFIANQSVLIRIEQDLHAAVPELRIKKEVIKHGAGDGLEGVTVTLRDDRVIEGYIDRIAEDGFTVLDRSTGKRSEVAYRIVKEIRDSDVSVGFIEGGIAAPARAIESVVELVY